MPSIRSVAIRSFLLLSMGGCAAAPPSLGDAGELAADLEALLAARADAVATARRSGDPWDLWAACLESSAPAVLAARRELLIAQARARSLGAPQSMVDAEHVGSGADRDSELMIALDLPGLVGAGRAGATRARAEVDAARAEEALAAAGFTTQHALERSLASLAVARELERHLAELEESCGANDKRLELLAGRGWLPPDQVAVARTMLHHVAVMRLEQQAAVAAARASVASASGLPPSSPWLDDAETTGLAAISRRTMGRADRPDPSARDLLDGHPELRLARFDYLGAEADVRVACAQRWPALLIGPKATLTVDDLLWGGVLRLELPWPPAADAAVDEARAARDQTHDALVAALARAQNEIVRRRAEQQAADVALREHGEGVAESSARAFRAAQARFAADVAAIPEWSMAIDQRARALTARAAALERWLVATFDLSEALGPTKDGGEEGAR